MRATRGRSEGARRADGASDDGGGGAAARGALAPPAFERPLALPAACPAALVRPLLAAATLAQRPEHYGFRPPSPDEVIETRLMPIERPLSLEKIAQVCGIDGATLWQLNPTLKQGITPPKHLYGKAFNLRLPKATPETCADELAKLPVEDNRFIQTYRIRRGDTLSGIAKRWGAKVLEIARANNITTRTTLRLGQKLIIPIPAHKRR